MPEKYLRCFAKYEGHEMPFMDLYNCLTKLKAVEPITRIPSIKMIGFSTDSKEVVEKIKNLEWITEVTYDGTTL